MMAVSKYSQDEIRITRKIKLLQDRKNELREKWLLADIQEMALRAQIPKMKMRYKPRGQNHG